jgi:HPt (histidine-containing phosphotransfer) domain-containing protein
VQRFLSKPVNRADLLSTLQRHLRVPAPAEGPATPRPDDDDDPVIREYLPQFVAQLPAHVRAMEALLDQQDLSELSKHVHQLSGAGGMYGFPQITRAAAEAERRMNGQEPLEAVRRGVEELIRLVRSVEGYEPARELPSRDATTGPKDVAA